MSNKFSLGSKALNNAITFNWAPEFLFIFENKKGNFITSYQSNAIHACMISSKVLKAFSSDPTISEMKFTAENIPKLQIDEYFQNIFHGFDISSKSIQYYLDIAQIIGTDDIIDEIMKIKNATLDDNNIILLIVLKMKANENYDEEIKLVAENFVDLIQQNVFDDCPSDYKIDILKSVLSIYKYQKTNDDEMEIIFNFIDTFDDSDFIKLFSLLNPKFTPQELIGRALKRVTQENIIDDFIIFLHDRFDSSGKKLAETTKEYLHSKGSLNGIFAALYERCGKNPVDTNEIQITTQGNTIRNTELKNIIDANNKSGIVINAKNTDHTRILFDFGDNKKVHLSGYEIKVRGEQNKYNFPKSWEIRGSNNNNSFELIDIKQNYNDFSAGKTKYFPIVHKKIECYRYIEYHQINNHGNPNEQKFLRLASIEFYGQLIYH